MTTAADVERVRKDGGPEFKFDFPPKRDWPYIALYLVGLALLFWYAGGK